ncbi:MAG: hypothetical protein GWN82_03195, partial [Gemmatimonadetes bacterium]|nr:hypothetical protein [Gemmatimonadota bacterium]NIT85938.1 hypothetical protein [Gemmatimonadota bacterium]NIU29758.1 hypothetical protein [Gemmatimonadota bacterium]NIW62828.1 hypothetical protein [Gemmatimonadota bacterium]
MAPTEQRRRPPPPGAPKRPPIPGTAPPTGRSSSAGRNGWPRICATTPVPAAAASQTIRPPARQSGRLYTWPVALESCPPGWRLPTEGDRPRL